MSRDALVWVTLDVTWFVSVLDACLAKRDLVSLRAELETLREALTYPEGEGLSSPKDVPTVELRKDVLLDELAQIQEAHTLERAKYYLRRLRRGVTEVRTSAINDINLNRWKEYDDILTDSLWVMDRRDSSGAHEAWYWGNFIPQIPHQMLRRYTKPGDWVLDTFLGSGTTLIECRRLGRNGMGVEINPKIVARTREVVMQEPNPHGVTTTVVQGDSTVLDYEALLHARGLNHVQLLIMHPPYYDIIQFGEDARDLSNADSLESFVDMFSQVVARTYPILESERYLVVVIGDKYVKGTWVPLGFYLMQAVLEQGYTLKSIVVKNFEQTRAKREKEALWRYRALAGGFYVFKHEYILLFTKL